MQGQTTKNKNTDLKKKFIQMNHLKWGKFFKYLKIYENKCKDGDKNGVLF